MASEQLPVPAPAPPTLPKLFPRWPLRLAGVVLSLLLVLALLAGGLLGSEAGARLLLTRLPVAGVHIEGVQGRLLGPLRLGKVTLDSPAQTIALTDLRLDWQPRALLYGKVHVTALHLASLDVTSKIDAPVEPLVLPARIALPVALQVDQVQVDGGAIRKGPASLMALGAFGFKLDFDGLRYVLQLDTLSARSDAGSGKFSGQASLSAVSPYALQASITSGAQARLAQRTLGATGRVDLRGSLAELVATIDLTVDAARVTGDAVLRPFSAQPLGRTTLAAKALDLSVLQSTLPKTALDIVLTARDAGSGQLAVTNAEAGSYDTQRLPLRDLQLDFSQQEGNLVFDRIAAALGSARLPAGTISGNGKFAQGALTLALALDGIDARRLDGRVNTTRLGGRFAVVAAGGKQEFTLDLSEPAGRNTLHVSAHATLADAALALDRAEVRLADGRLLASGRLMLSGTQAFRLDGKLVRLRSQDLGQFAQVPPLELTGDFALAGALAPQMTADLGFHLVDSLVAGRPLRGEGDVQLRAETLNVPKLQLIAGDNRLTVQGALAQRQSTLNFVLDAQKLDQLGAAFGGAITASGNVRGDLRKPAVTAEWKASGLRLPGALHIASLQGTADVQIDPGQAFSLDHARIDATAAGVRSASEQLAELSAHVDVATRADSPLDIRIIGNGVSAGGFVAEKFAVTASGTTARHTLAASMNDTAQSWRIGAAGGLAALRPQARWDGKVEQFEGTGQVALKLLAPASLSVAQQRVTLEDFRLGAGKSTLTIAQFLRDASGIVTRGSFTRLDVAALLALVSPTPPIVSDLQLGGEWNLTIADAASGSLRVRRESGDVSVRGSTPVALGLSRLEASVEAIDGRLDARLLADGKQLGQIDVTVRTQTGRGDARFTLPAGAALNGTAHIAIPALNWLGPVLMPTLLTEGRLQSDIVVSGTVGQPRFGGKIAGSDLRVFLSEQGIDLRKGVLDSVFEGERLVLRTLRFDSGGGTLAASGPINLVAGLPEAQISLKADHFPLLERSDRKLVLSGQSEVGWRDRRATITGAFKVDAGSVDLGRAGAPELSDDVVIVGRTTKSGQPVAAAVDVTIDLGPGVTLSGRGLDALLDGQLRIVSSGGDALRGQGTLTIARGTYSAYGRKLAIEQGVLRFNGPLNNPSLDILAMRRGLEVEAGVAVRGTVMVPRVTLVSEPTVTDAEKLSWLVLGRALATAGSGDAGVLQAAAAALLSQGAAAGVESQLASTFGLENFSVGKSSDSLQQRIVTVGKQISARLYVSYEQGLESTNSVLHFRYQLSPKLTLEAEAGARSALSLFYNVLFD